MMKQSSRIVPAVPEMARQGTEAPVRDWSWVEASVWTERMLAAHSYGFRPGRGCKDGLREVDGLIKAGYTHVVDADLAGYFDSIPKAALLQRVAERISDGGVLSLIEAFLEQDVVKGMERWRPASGTPQGAVMSPLLANLYLHSLDCLLEQRGYRMVRYADDFVVLCASAQQAQAALAEVRRWVDAHGLRLNADKTHVGDCTRVGEGFELLGYRFEAGTRRVRRKSYAALRDKIRAQTGRSRSGSLRTLIDDLNPMLRGWFNYFKHIYPAARFFQLIDGFVRRRLRAILCRRHRRAHQFGRNLWASKKWSNAFLAEQGLFTMVEAHAAAS